MSTITLPAHFDGQQIVLDTPYDIAPGTRLLIRVFENDEERDDWLRLSAQNLARAYGDDEPEYTAADIKDITGTKVPAYL